MNKRILVISIVTLSFLLSCSKDNVTNPTSENFSFVTIGSQVWMTKNLDVDHYRNGDEIPQVTDPTKWAKLTTGAWCYYNNNPANGKVYGKLYNWYAVNDPRGLAPAGWHVPSDSEWTTLTNYLGGESIAGSKLNETGTAHWSSPNIGATNESGFSAIPGGYRHCNGPFYLIGSYGLWWSSSESNASSAWYRSLNYNFANIITANYYKELGFSVRCIEDI